jgi:hypothetical protein
LVLLGAKCQWFCSRPLHTSCLPDSAEKKDKFPRIKKWHVCSACLSHDTYLTAQFIKTQDLEEVKKNRPILKVVLKEQKSATTAEEDTPTTTTTTTTTTAKPKNSKRKRDQTSTPSKKSVKRNRNIVTDKSGVPSLQQIDNG